MLLIFILLAQLRQFTLSFPPTRSRLNHVLRRSNFARTRKRTIRSFNCWIYTIRLPPSATHHWSMKMMPMREISTNNYFERIIRTTDLSSYDPNGPFQIVATIKPTGWSSLLFTRSESIVSYLWYYSFVSCMLISIAYRQETRHFFIFIITFRFEKKKKIKYRSLSLRCLGLKTRFFFFLLNLPSISFTNRAHYMPLLCFGKICIACISAHIPLK